MTTPVILAVGSKEGEPGVQEVTPIQSSLRSCELYETLSKRRLRGKQSLLCTVFQLYEKLGIILKEKGILHPRNTAKWRERGSGVFGVTLGLLDDASGKHSHPSLVVPRRT